jgi:hypothetical protein
VHVFRWKAALSTSTVSISEDNKQKFVPWWHALASPHPKLFSLFKKSAQRGFTDDSDRSAQASDPSHVVPMLSENPQNVPPKANLRNWWNSFTFAQKAKKEAEARKGGPSNIIMLSCRTANMVTRTGEVVHTVFGKPLRESLKYASVQISTANANGELYVWGYIPVVVAKCGLYLKENATEVEGTFRVNGSSKRMRELQAEFEKPPRVLISLIVHSILTGHLQYGKSLDWKKENYNTHDVASVFRRYLTQMPEPVIPYDMYHGVSLPLETIDADIPIPNLFQFREALGGQIHLYCLFLSLKHLISEETIQPR